MADAQAVRAVQYDKRKLFNMICICTKMSIMHINEHNAYDINAIIRSGM